MSSKKVDGEGEEKASPEDGAYEEPDEEVEGMKAALTAAQREDLKAELEHEIAQLTIKNIALKEKIGKVEKEMTEGITSREAVIAGESETTKTMGEDAAALDADARLEQDALAAALAARTAAKANAVRCCPASPGRGRLSGSARPTPRPRRSARGPRSSPRPSARPRCSSRRGASGGAARKRRRPSWGRSGPSSATAAARTARRRGPRGPRGSA
jgi:hypothetical protein